MAANEMPTLLRLHQLEPYRLCNHTILHFKKNSTLINNIKNHQKQEVILMTDDVAATGVYRDVKHSTTNHIDIYFCVGTTIHVLY